MRNAIDNLRERRWSHLLVANLRILLGFAFVPAGLKKALGQPFTDPGNQGTFHEFLHAFHATGWFYAFVGGIQLVIAVLLMTQTFGTLGALMALPVLTCIMVFCWSTGVVPTAIVVTLMFFGVVALLVWDMDRWLTIVSPGYQRLSPFDAHTLIDLTLWRACGTAILVFYGLACLVHGGVYRPKGMDLDATAFYALLLIPLFPVVTLIVEQRRRAHARSR